MYETNCWRTIKENIHIFNNVSSAYWLCWLQPKYLKKGYITSRSSLVAKALDYKLEGRGFEIQWGKILNVSNPSSRSRPWGLFSL
jgi:hypothetical protein